MNEKFTFPDKVKEVLKNFTMIHPSMVVYPNKVEVINYAKSVIGTYNFDEEMPFEGEIGIVETNELLSILNTFKEATIAKSEKYLAIAQGNFRTKYFTTAKMLLPKVLIHGKHSKEDITSKLDQIGPELDIVLSAENLAVLIKTSNLLKSKFIFFETDGDDVKITVGNDINSSSNSNTLTLKPEDIKVNKLPKVVKINMNDIHLMPLDHEIKIHSAGITYWKNSVGVEYIIGLSAE